MKYEWEAGGYEQVWAARPHTQPQGGYEKVSATPRAPGLSDSALTMATRCK